MRRRRAVIVLIVGTIILVLLGGAMPGLIEESLPAERSSTATQTSQPSVNTEEAAEKGTAIEALSDLSVKGRAPKAGYERSQFGSGWSNVNGCSTRDIILYRDLVDTTLDGECKVVSGILNDPYTGEVIQFTKLKSADVQIDHVIALSDAWQKGAQSFTPELRKQLANDPLELLAVSGAQNQEKSDGDAATWLPKNKSFRCEYVARQIAVKKKYSLWVTQPEKDAMLNVLGSCPGQALP